MIVGILGIAFCVAHMGQRQVVLASERAFHQMHKTSASNNKMTGKNSGDERVMNAQRCFMYGRAITLVALLMVASLVICGIVLKLVSPTSMIERQITGVRLFGAGIAVACVVFTTSTVVSSSYVIKVIQDHMASLVAMHNNMEHTTDIEANVASTTSNNPTMRPKSTDVVVAMPHSSEFKHSTTFLLVIQKLKRLRMLVTVCLIGSFTIGAIMVVLPGTIEYIFPVSVANGSVLVCIYIALDSGIPSEHGAAPKRTVIGTGGGSSSITRTKSTSKTMSVTTMSDDGTTPRTTFGGNSNNHDSNASTAENDHADAVSSTIFCGMCIGSGPASLTFGSSSITSGSRSGSSVPSGRSRSMDNSASENSSSMPATKPPSPTSPEPPLSVYKATGIRPIPPLSTYSRGWDSTNSQQK